MEIMVNGERREVAKQSTLGDLLAELGITPENLAVEHNGEMLASAEPDRALTEGDRLEIVRFVGGG